MKKGSDGQELIEMVGLEEIEEVIDNEVRRYSTVNSSDFNKLVKQRTEMIANKRLISRTVDGIENFSEVNPEHYGENPISITEF